MIPPDQYQKLKRILNQLSIEDSEFICKLMSRDPLTNIYWKLLVLYILILSCFLLWPFDFNVYVKNHTHWIGDSTGIEFQKSGQVKSHSSTRQFFEHLVKGDGLTVELWLETSDLVQSGPARIISYSKNPGLRNFTIGQLQDRLVVRLRTTETNLNGTNPHIIIDDIFDGRSLQHVVVTYDLSEQRVYIDGEQRLRSTILRGDFSNWDSSCSLTIGNEITGDRPWLGKIYYAAVFNRPLPESEIIRNYHSGLQTAINRSRPGDSSAQIEPPVARFLFDEGKGDVIHDNGSDLTTMNLFIPRYIHMATKPFLDFSTIYLENKSWFADAIINIMIFIPLGILIHGLLRTRWGVTLKISLAAFIAGTLFTLTAESVQYFSLTRNSSLIDVSTNMAGTALGIAMDRAYCLLLNFRSERFQMLFL